MPPSYDVDLGKFVSAVQKSCVYRKNNCIYEVNDLLKYGGDSMSVQVDADNPITAFSRALDSKLVKLKESGRISEKEYLVFRGVGMKEFNRMWNKGKANYIEEKMDVNDFTPNDAPSSEKMKIATQVANYYFGKYVDETQPPPTANDFEAFCERHKIKIKSDTHDRINSEGLSPIGIEIVMMFEETFSKLPDGTLYGMKQYVEKRPAAE